MFYLTNITTIFKLSFEYYLINLFYCAVCFEYFTNIHGSKYIIYALFYSKSIESKNKISSNQHCSL